MSVKISELTNTPNTITGAELVEVVQAGLSHKTTTKDIATASNIGTYASVRLLDAQFIYTQLYVSGRSNVFDGAQGVFQYDPSDTTTPDDDGTVLVDAAGRRWKRQFSGSPQLEWWGAGIDADYSPNMQAALDTGRVCEFSTPIKISSDVWIKSGGGIVGIGDGAVIVLDNGARIRAEKGEGFRAFDATAQYWNEILPPSTPLSQISVSASRGQFSVTVASAAGFAPGDYVFVFNGYCDHWRQLEQGSDVSLFNSDAVDLAAGEVHKVLSVSGNTLNLEAALVFDYPITPKLYGGLPDENVLPMYAGKNVPIVHKLIGSTGIVLKNFSVEDGGDVSATFYKSAIDLEQVAFCEISCIKIRGSRTILLNNKCHHNTISNIDSVASLSSCLRLEAFCCYNNISDCKLVHGYGNDAALLLNLRPYLNNISNIVTEGLNSTNINTIGVYLNGGYSNNVSNVTSTNLQTAVALQFDCYDNNIANVTASMTGNLFVSYYARRNTYKNFNRNGQITTRYGVQELVDVLVYYSKDEQFSGGSIYSTSLRGFKLQGTERVKISGVKMRGQQESVYIFDRANYAETQIVNNDFDNTSMCVRVEFNDPDSVDVLPIVIRENVMKSGGKGISVSNLKYVEVLNNRIQAQAGVIDLIYSSFYRIEGNVFLGPGSGAAIIYGSVAGSQFLSSHGDVRNNEYLGFGSILFAGYVRPARDKTGGHRGVRMTMLDVWPDIEEWLYTATTEYSASPSAWAKVARL